MRNEAVKELFKIALKQVFFITLMSIKGGAPDICSINHILDCDFVIMLFENQFNERLAQRAPRAAPSTIIFLLRRHNFHLQTMIVSLSIMEYSRSHVSEQYLPVCPVQCAFYYLS